LVACEKHEQYINQKESINDDIEKFVFEIAHKMGFKSKIKRDEETVLNSKY